MNYKQEFNRWLSEPCVDESTKEELMNLTDGEIEDRFYRDLEFGTGGLRGIMGAGTNRMNVYTIRRATQGLAEYVKSNGDAAINAGVVIAYDSRNNSRIFAGECASVLSANKIRSYMFDSLSPTPELSFAVRELGCFAGIVITASHNPKEYNGYKVYGKDGGQLPPLDAMQVLDFILATDIFKDVKICENPDTVLLSKELEDKYIAAVLAQSLGIPIEKDLKIVYTPLHGTGNLPVRRVLAEIGVKELYIVKEQEAPDGNFPTVISPNPENISAFDIAKRQAEALGADLIIATDPDSDRVGIMARDSNGGYLALNGNQTGALLSDFIFEKMSEAGMPENPRLIKTIVTTELARKIAESYGVTCIDVLTGFKYIGDKIKEYETRGEHFIFGLEESYGYLKGTYARDKDAVVASMLIAELASECKRLGTTIPERLYSLYEKHGYHKEKLLSYTLKGIDGTRKIDKIMEEIRALPPLAGEVKRVDYSQGTDGLPPSNVVKIFLNNGWLCARPSGTEPKIKFYTSASCPSPAEADATLDALSSFVEGIVGKFID